MLCISETKTRSCQYFITENVLHKDVTVRFLDYLNPCIAMRVCRNHCINMTKN